MELNPGNEKVCIRNYDGLSKCVLLLPVTRTDELSRKKWQQTLKLLELDEPIIIVILDKTPNSEINDYCSKKYYGYTKRLYILCRPINESVFESQKHIILDSRLWITQIHDDDEWSGLPTVPKNAQEFDVFIFNINKVLTTKLTEQILSGKLSTQEIIFGAVPAKIWNGFVSFLSAQGDPLADSLDSSLYLLCDVFGSIKVRDNFSYIWVSDNWTDHAKAILTLKSSTLKMGWGEYAGVNAALTHRAFDQFSAYGFCSIIFQQALSKESILHVTSRFALLNPLGLERLVKFRRVRIALTATRDTTNFVLRLIEIGIFLCLGHHKIKKLDSLALYLIGAEPISKNNVFHQHFMTCLEQIPNPFFQRKFRFWKNEIDKIIAILNKQ